MQLVTPAQIRSKFDLTIHKDDDYINTSIEAVENVYLKAYLTNELYSFLLENVNVSPANELADKLMSGGIYEMSPYKKHFNGLTEAVCFLAYADLLIKQTVVTRYGAVNKTDARSQNQTYSELVTQISRLSSVGKKYLEDVIEYLNTLDAEDYTIEAIYITKAQANKCFRVDGILNEWI